jgi:D-amino-acid oxidase
MNHRERDVLVIGAGVAGLSTALCLAEAGWRVSVQAAEPPLATTSAVAGALWGPYLVGRDERVARWTATSLTWFLDLLGEPGSGVRMISGMEVSRTAHPDPPDSIANADGTALQPATGVPAGYAAGWQLTAPVIDMPAYLAYLLGRLGRAGVPVQDGRRFATLADAVAASPAEIIVNCTGTGAHDLVPDPGVTAVRGQAVVVVNPGVHEFFVGTGDDPNDLTYYFPHERTVVLGGTSQEGDWRTEPDPATAERILAACAAVEPRLSGAEIIAHRVGLRPLRPTVRLAAEDLPGGRRVVHNYGHGGAGVTLSWGCALDVAAVLAGQPAAAG